MSLSSSLYTGTSGLRNMGNGMQVVGNNIANTNTLGFKSGRSTFSDTLYETTATQAGTAQVGRGMAVGSVTNNFDQGSFESTGNATDLSIGGDGFFIVRQPGTDNDYYTRAGNFYFDATGQMVNQEGYVVQGWKLDPDTGDDTGAIGDIILDAFTSSPEKSTKVTAITNLDADAESKKDVLSNAWDSGADTYISSGSYEYQTVVQVYDSLGSSHDVTIYYDKKSGTEWEYVITCDPDEDNRNLVQETDSKGLLARGTITFSESSGDILDMTMETFTGRLGNFTATGVNTVDEIEYNIQDYEAMPLDGYGFEFEYDGSTWDFVDQNNDNIISATDKPDNFGNATIIYSDATTIRLAFDGDTDTDLEIQLSQAAVATDTIGFDINAEDGLHYQDIEGLTYSGQITNDDTSLNINDPTIMTHDNSDIGIVWNPVTETWHWSNPEVANSGGTLVAGVEFSGTAQSAATVVNVINAEYFDLVASDVTLMVDNRTGQWDWNMPLKDDDFSTTFSESNNTATLTISSVGNQGAVASSTSTGVATTNVLTWNGTTWSSTDGGGQTEIVIDTANSSSSQVQFYIWENDGIGGSAGASTAVYTFGTALGTAGGQTISFSVDPAPPEEYPGASIDTSGSTASGFGIDWNGDSTVDMEMLPSANGTTTAAGGLQILFDIDPDEPPENYSNATLTGDQTQAIIDLDGSGAGSNDDIVFSFDPNLTLGSSTDVFTDRGKINFDILGSTAWTSIPDSDVTNDGFFAFTSDFLGGDFGSTEMDLEFNVGSTYDGNNWINDSLSTTQFAKKSSTTYQDADGYAAGDLESVDVSSDGTITGNYSNGQLIPLFRVGLAKFYNNYGLHAEGGNLFTETNDSGEAITNRPGENGLGTIAPNSLEMSNVDISTELVKMIEIQRGYQGNSKTITTVDEMLQTVINMK
ncbi:MAG: flagellar hook-basal body complex protein [Desulfobacter sp.]